MTKAEIKIKYKEIHDNLSEDYYEKHLMSKEDFDYLHGQNWIDMEAELIAEGYRQPPEPPLVFEPPAGTGIPEKVEYIEQFLERLYGKS